MKSKSLLSRHKSIWIIGLFVICPIFFLGSGSSAADNQIIDVAVNSFGIQVTALSPVNSIMLRVANSQGEIIFDQSSDGDPIQWSVTNAGPDGIYSYEMRAGREEKRTSRVEPRQTGHRIAPCMQSGTVFIKDGAIVLPTEKESRLPRKTLSGIAEIAWTTLMDFLVPAVYADVVHSDDVIITGSECIGFDCLTDGTESFGFDTIKLKENNLQIYFDDTSSTAGFPANDWRIVINDSASGGASYFVIEDSTNATRPFNIRAKAPTNSLFISDSGKIGLGTSIPAQDVHIISGDNPALRLEQDTTAGFTAQTWDISGNESGFFIRDVTGGYKLPFRIRAGAPDNSLTLNPEGKLGIGKYDSSYILDVSGQGSTASQLHWSYNGEDAGGWLTSAGDNNFYISSGAMWDGTGWVQKSADGRAVMVGSGAEGFKVLTRKDCPAGGTCASSERMRIDYRGRVGFGIKPRYPIHMKSGACVTVGGVWTNASSRKYKDQVKDLSADEALKTLMELKPVTFSYKADPQDKHVGFIAEDVPDLVATPDREGLSPMDITAVMTKVVKEQQQTMEKQQDTIGKQQITIEKQQQAIEQLNDKMNMMEQMVNTLRAGSMVSSAKAP